MAHQTSSDPNVFILPDLGEGVHEAELISWKVKPGDAVEEHQTLAEMETDKALVEVPSPRSGVIETLHGKQGEICKVGNPLVTYRPEAGSGGGSGGFGGNDAQTFPPPDDIPSGRDDDVIARQIREAAMREPDPELREKLWDEYRNYTGLSR